EGEGVVNLDNASGAFGWKALDQVLTGTTHKGRLLGKTKRTPEMRIETIFLATGNNLVLRGDTPRRAVPCRLVPECERPEERSGFCIPDLKGHVRQHPPQLAMQALTILHAFHLARRRQADLPVFGSFEKWSAFVRQAVVWSFGHDPCAARAHLKAETRVGGANLEALFDAWAGLPGGTDRQHGVTVRKALALAAFPAHQ